MLRISEKEDTPHHGLKARRRTPAGRRRVGPVVAAVVAALGLAITPAMTAAAEPPPSIPENATPGDLKWQPSLDYDGDGCYPTAAVGPDGTAAEGLKVSGAQNGNCADQSDLDNANAYVRTACQDGWCAHKYGFYFEKDQIALGPAAHRHDWEHIVVWVKDDKPKFVAVSQHGGYDIRPVGDVRAEDDQHAKVVYHQDGGSSHSFRFAAAEDDPPENLGGVWQRPTLLSWDLLEPQVRNTLSNHNYGDATVALKDSAWSDDLAKAKPDEVPFDTSRLP